MIHLRRHRKNTILLAHSYYLAYDEKQTRKMKPYPPLGTLLTAAVLRELGHPVELFDAMLSSGVQEFIDALDAVQPRIVGIVEDNFNFLTKMCTVRMREAAFEMIRAAKARGCMVVVNGSDATDQTATYVAAGADAVIVGEVEQTLAEVVTAWSVDPRASLAHIPGLTFDVGGMLVRTSPRVNVEDLDNLPLPAWDLIDAERYRDAWTRAHGRLSWNLTTARGCPYKCNWCAKPLFGVRYTQRSAEGVVAELELLRDTIAPDHIWFTDDIFGLTLPWIESFAREVTARGVRIPYLAQERVNLMKPPFVAALAESGAEEIWLGVESGSQKILDAMEKGTRVDQIRSATGTLRSHGVRAAWFVQLGYLGEEWQDILETRDLIREEMPDEIGVSISYPLPGTRFHEMVKDQLGLKKNWLHSDDLSMIFHGTYKTDFYRELRDLLHDENRVWRTASAAERSMLDRRWTDMERRESASRSDATVTVSA